MVGLGAGETITLRATAEAHDRGCHAQVGFENADGRLVTRSLNVNLAPGLSSSTHYVVAGVLSGRMAVRPVAWIEGAGDADGDCTLAAQISDPAGKVVRKLTAGPDCKGRACSGITVSALGSSTLRLYVAAAKGKVCRAQMGFRLSNGRASAVSKYVTLLPDHAEYLSWRSGDDDFSLTDSVTPVAAMHQRDACVATAETFASENEPATSMIPVHSYVFPVVGLASDPASITKTIHTLEENLRSNPDDLWVINALAQVYDRHGEQQQAIKLLSSAVGIYPRASESWLLLAKLQYGQGDYKAAITALERCLALDPENNVARAAYADSLTQDGRVDEAGGLFAQLLQDDRTRTPAVLTAYADLLRQEGRLAETLDAVEQANTRHPNCRRTLCVQSTILMSLKRLPEATQSAEQAVRLDSNSRPARLLLARLYFVQGKKQEAAAQVAWLQANFKPAH
ncbi:MAG TPA: tetratricopeptide repeat protein [Terriglobia bacterium]|nr:tetratricopeptide repeat protein [Terriglobia bacterium]